MPSKYQQAKVRRRLRAQAEEERDTVHEVLFVRAGWKEGDAPDKKHFPKIPVVRDPKKYPHYLQQAIEEFQKTHDVADWRQIASRYEFRSYWYG
jgi:hypothetical protein